MVRSSHGTYFFIIQVRSNRLIFFFINTKMITRFKVWTFVYFSTCRHFDQCIFVDAMTVFVCPAPYHVLKKSWTSSSGPVVFQLREQVVVIGSWIYCGCVMMFPFKLFAGERRFDGRAFSSDDEVKVEDQCFLKYMAGSWYDMGTQKLLQHYKIASTELIFVSLKNI